MLINVGSKTQKLAKRVRHVLQARLARLHPEPVIILGHQKTGTSVIAALLGEATDKTVTIDMFHLNNLRKPHFREDLYNGELSLASFVKDNKIAFASDIIKEPDLTFHYRPLSRLFPEAKFVFVVRDPRDTIRSILNRLKIPGNLDEINDLYKGNLSGLKGWQHLIAGKYPHVCGETYIERMANRWNLAADIYNQHKNHMTLIRYEDFLQNKIGSINWLARQVDLSVVNDISKKVDVQYQPRGDRNVNRVDFFGNANLSKIQNICHIKMMEFNYLI